MHKNIKGMKAHPLTKLLNKEIGMFDPSFYSKTRCFFEWPNKMTLMTRVFQKHKNNKKIRSIIATYFIAGISGAGRNDD